MAAPTTGPYLVSATYFAGFIRALRGRTLLTPAIEAELPQPQREMVAMPWSTRWWEGGATEGLTTIMLQRHGPALLEEVGFLTTRNSVGPIITPLVSVIGALFGLRPSTLFERIGELATTSIRGVSFDWKSTGPSTGTLTIIYPTPFGGPTVAPLWQGTCRFIFETSKTPGQVTATEIDGSKVTLTVSWEAKR